MAKNLSELKINETAYIRCVRASDPRLRRRLTDMGLTPMTEITLVKYAPMGDPMELHLRGYSLSLRRDDANLIELMSEEEALHNFAVSGISERNRKADAEQMLSENEHEDVVDFDEHERAKGMTMSIIKASQCAKRENKCSGCNENCIRLNFNKTDSGIDCSDCPNAEDGTDHPVKLALVGNPNCGKTTLFNAMTGEKEYVGNWPGVTVEKKEGKVKNAATCADGLCTHGHEMTLVDLPGIYSLSPYTMEERVARKYIIEEHPDAIINIVDATNLERNLYLSVQLLELERPMVIALNMMDEVEKHGDEIDCVALSHELGIPVVPISARTGDGIDELISNAQLILHTAHSQLHEGFRLEPDHLYDDYTHGIHHSIGALIDKYAEAAGLPAHWAGIKLLEGDAPVYDKLNLPEEIKNKVEALTAEYAGAVNNSFMDGAAMLADSRYRYIERLSQKVLKKNEQNACDTVSDRIDRILTNKYLAIPIFALILSAVFILTFGTLGAWMKGLAERLVFDIIIPSVSSALSAALAPRWFISLVCDGALTGIGGVITFLPEIAILFLCLSLLEDSGYMSRIAFMMDRPMRKLGLSGKSFIPLLMGFGCTVPALMGTRTMENMRDKRSTMLLLPFMSCSAKLPVYGLLAGAFFSRGSAIVVISLYIMGILLAAVVGMVFKKTLFRADDANFLLELPPYRLPKVKDTALHVWERVKHFLVKAGTLIFAMSVVVWFFMNFDFSFHMVGDRVDESIIGTIGGAIAGIFKPLGFGTWTAAVALLTGLIAKESIVSTLSVLLGVTLTGGAQTATALGTLFTPLSAYSFLVFVLLYTPCVAAVATMRREMQSAKWTVFAIGFQLVMAYAAAFLVYTIGLLFA